MHFDVALSRLVVRERAEATDARDPLAIASLVVALCRRMRACVDEAIAMARWGYSRIRIWLDFSGDGGWPLQRVDESGG